MHFTPASFKYYTQENFWEMMICSGTDASCKGNYTFYRSCFYSYRCSSLLFPLPTKLSTLGYVAAGSGITHFRGAFNYLGPFSCLWPCIGGK